VYRALACQNASHLLSVLESFHPLTPLGVPTLPLDREKAFVDLKNKVDTKPEREFLPQKDVGRCSGQLFVLLTDIVWLRRNLRSLEHSNEKVASILSVAQLRIRSDFPYSKIQRLP